jgi:hypothetical protein
MITSTFDSPYWNLAQAALWVRFRRPSLVKRFEVADRDAYVAVNFYSKMDPDTKNEISSVLELEKALQTGKAKARGYFGNDPVQPKDIPCEQWIYLSLRPPYAYDQRHVGSDIEIWSDITVRSQDLKRLWRGHNETSLRQKYDWEEVKGFYLRAKDDFPDASQNNLIDKTQMYYDAEHKAGSAPSRPSIQNHIKTWK